MTESQYSSFREAEQGKVYDFPEDCNVVFPGSYFSWIRPQQREKEDQFIEKLTKPSLTDRVKSFLRF